MKSSEVLLVLDGFCVTEIRFEGIPNQWRRFWMKEGVMPTSSSRTQAQTQRHHLPKTYIDKSTGTKIAKIFSPNFNLTLPNRLKFKSSTSLLFFKLLLNKTRLHKNNEMRNYGATPQRPLPPPVPLSRPFCFNQIPLHVSGNAMCAWFCQK